MPRRKKNREGTGPLGLGGLTPAEIERLSDGNERALAVRPHGSAEASLPLAGPLRDPGFGVVPWQARPEVESGLGKYCPKHLQVYTDEEKDEAHYPHASRDEGGLIARYCWACGRPLKDNGLSAMGHRGRGKPCPACGFKRKVRLTESQKNGLKKGQALVASAQAEGLSGRAMWEHVKENAPRDGPAQEKRDRAMVRAGQNTTAVRSLTELMRMRNEERADTLLRPYYAALDLEVREDWSPSTKLEFYNGQTAIAEKLLNRTEGLPVARHRNVDAEDRDVIPEGELSPRVVARLVAAIVAGDAGDLVEDAEFEEVVDAA